MVNMLLLLLLLLSGSLGFARSPAAVQQAMRRAQLIKVLSKVERTEEINEKANGVCRRREIGEK
jgi:hypothetical protein